MGHLTWNNRFHHCYIHTGYSLSTNVKISCQNQQTCEPTALRFHFLGCAIANLSMILVVLISNRTLCSILFNTFGSGVEIRE